MFLRVEGFSEIVVGEIVVKSPYELRQVVSIPFAAAALWAAASETETYNQRILCRALFPRGVYGRTIQVNDRSSAL